MSAATKPRSSVPPIQSWPSLEAYLEENPSSKWMWGRLQQGHLLNTGHDWRGKLFLSPDRIVYFERECC